MTIKPINTPVLKPSKLHGPNCSPAELCAVISHAKIMLVEFQLVEARFIDPPGRYSDVIVDMISDMEGEFQWVLDQWNDLS